MTDQSKFSCGRGCDIIQVRDFVLQPGEAEVLWYRRMPLEISDMRLKVNWIIKPWGVPCGVQPICANFYEENHLYSGSNPLSYSSDATYSALTRVCPHLRMNGKLLIQP